MPPRIPAALAATLALIGSGSAAQGQDTLLLRQDSLAEAAGRSELRDLGGLDVEFPVRCEDGRSGCVEPLDLDRVLALTFFEERRGRPGPGGPVETRISQRGTVLLGARLDDARAGPLIDGLAGLVQGLEPGSFRAPFAGLSDESPALAAGTLTAWGDLFLVCFRDEAGDALYRHGRSTDDEGNSGFGSAGYTDPDFTRPICERLASSLPDAPAEVIRTMTRPLSVLELRVEAEGLAGIPDRAVDENRTTLPDGIELSTGPTADGATGGRGAYRDGTLHRGYVIRDGARHDAATRPAEIGPELLDRAFPLRLTWSLTERTFGPRPQATRVEEGELIAGVFLIGRGTDPAPLYPARWSDAIAQRLDAADRIDRAVVLQALLDAHPELAVEGYVLVTCAGDETARFHLPPSMVDNRVTNPGATCDTLRKRLD